MLKLGGVATPMLIKINRQELNSEHLSCIVGGNELTATPLRPYDERICSFLAELSQRLQKYRAYPDVVTFAFWCRKANIMNLKARFNEENIRIGRGIVFHVTPSNVPINFAFSFAFGLLSGNCNVVRIPTKEFPQINIVCSAINELLKEKQYSDFNNRVMFLKYERNEEITRFLSAHCDVRIIWGGDTAIQQIRSYPIPERSIEIMFADRYSMAIIDFDAVGSLSENEMNKLAENFYNDTYLMDQNACSSPQLIIWQGKRKEKFEEKFWKSVYRVAEQKYILEPVHAVDKFTNLCDTAINYDEIKKVRRYGNHVYCIELDRLPKCTESLRGKFGMFYEYYSDTIQELTPIVTKKYQTLSYFGVKKEDLVSWVIENGLQGIDRIVPIGKAMEMDLIWDGYDILCNLSRIIDVK